eukprot:1959010-Amphidinium_carterae.1
MACATCFYAPESAEFAEEQAKLTAQIGVLTEEIETMAQDYVHSRMSPEKARGFMNPKRTAWRKILCTSTLWEWVSVCEMWKEFWIDHKPNAGRLWLWKKVCCHCRFEVVSYGRGTLESSWSKVFLAFSNCHSTPTFIRLGRRSFYPCGRAAEAHSGHTQILQRVAQPVLKTTESGASHFEVLMTCFCGSCCGPKER